MAKVHLVLANQIAMESKSNRVVARVNLVAKERVVAQAEQIAQVILVAKERMVAQAEQIALARVVNSRFDLRMAMIKKVANLGIGIGLRPVHFQEIFDSWPPIDWFEIISENFMAGGMPVRNLEKILERYPVVMHGVTLAIGSAAPLDWEYLKKLKELAVKTKTPWLSDHLCWGQLPGMRFHDLLPLPRTKEVVNYVAERARVVQDYLEIPFALENLSSYANFADDEMTEWEFYAEVVEKADISMMLDVNNIYVSSRNEGFDPKEYYSNLPLNRVIQIHLAGHADHGRYIIDTHDHPVCDAVWEIYRQVYQRTEGVSTLLEWDDRFIPFEETWKEALKAKEFQKEIIHA